MGGNNILRRFDLASPPITSSLSWSSSIYPFSSSSSFISKPSSSFSPFNSALRGPGDVGVSQAWELSLVLCGDFLGRVNTVHDLFSSLPGLWRLSLHPRPHILHVNPFCKGNRCTIWLLVWPRKRRAVGRKDTSTVNYAAHVIVPSLAKCTGCENTG